MSSSTIESILLEAKSLSPVERYELAMAILETLREPLGAPKAKRSRKAAASADGDAAEKPKRAPTSWNIGCAAVREAIKAVDGYKPPHVMAFAKTLKTADEAGWATMNASAIVTAYTSWLADNSDVGSRTSGGSKASKPSKAELTDDEKAAKRKAAAEKRKATIAAKKAAEALAATVPSAVVAPEPKADAESDDEDEELEDDDAVVMTSWEHDFGDGAKMYARYEKDDKVYLYETDCETYIGELKGKKKFKIDASTPNPIA